MMFLCRLWQTDFMKLQFKYVTVIVICPWASVDQGEVARVSSAFECIYFLVFIYLFIYIFIFIFKPLSFSVTHSADMEPHSRSFWVSLSQNGDTKKLRRAEGSCRVR